jgi:tetraacyldisaccharide 4'-kinase
MSITQRWHDLLAARQPSALQRLSRAGLGLLADGYALGVAANLWVFDRALLQRQTLPCPVISVGNLTLGGTGKTTACAFLAERLLSRGIVPAVILRGHRRRGRGRLLVSDGADVLAEPDESGDEAYMLTRLVPGAVVAVGKWREDAGRMVLRDTPAEAVILDDGFQYFRMHRDLDIVLLDALDPLTADARLFPAGTLREPLAQLRRAHLLWLTHSDLASAAALGNLKALAAGAAPGVPWVEVIHRPTSLRPVHESGTPHPPDFLAGKRVAALSGIGHPKAFERTVRRLGAAHVEPTRFPDHHRYSARDGQTILRRAQSSDLIVTTEKDAVRLPEVLRTSGKAYALGIEAEITANADALEAALDRALGGT